MTGQTENRVSYPQFFRLHDGNLLFFYRDGGSGRAVVVYCSLDRHYSEPVLRLFEERTCIRVLARYDTEAERSYVRFDPLGPIFAIMPWNFPLWQVFRFAVPNLAAGNVGLLKHAASTTGCALAIEEVLAEAGLPEGGFTVLLIGHAAAADVIGDARVRGVTLTGSDRAGRAIASTAGQHLKKTVLELGGSDPLLVLDDANLAEAAKNAVASRYLNSGQSCINAKRIIVDRSVSSSSSRVTPTCGGWPPWPRSSGRGTRTGSSIPARSSPTTSGRCGYPPADPDRDPPAGPTPSSSGHGPSGSGALGPCASG